MDLYVYTLHTCVYTYNYCYYILLYMRVQHNGRKFDGDTAGIYTKRTCLKEKIQPPSTSECRRVSLRRRVETHSDAAAHKLLAANTS